MTSDLKSATSRANGAKSNGPKTAEGREKSSRNSLTHGFTSKKTIVLKCENEGEFQKMLGYYATTYQPCCPRPRGFGSRDGRLPLAHGAPSFDRNCSDR